MTAHRIECIVLLHVVADILPRIRQLLEQAGAPPIVRDELARANELVCLSLAAMRRETT
jgi:hypothetical protein